MGLEDDDGALVIERLHGVQQRLQLARMVGIVVIHVRAVILALELEAASRAIEAGKAVLDGIRPDAEADGCGGRGKGVLHIVHPRNMQDDVRELSALIHNVKT